MKIKFYTLHIDEYFGKFLNKHWIENLSNLFDANQVLNPTEKVYEIETDNILNLYKVVFNSISELCLANELQGREFDFFVIFYISDIVEINLYSDNADKQYHRDLFSVFFDLLKIKNDEIEEKPLTIHINKQAITSGFFIYELKNKILDYTAEYFEGFSWGGLSTIGKINLIYKVEKYLKETKPGRGRNKKPIMLKQFISALNVYVYETIPDNKFESARKRYSFIGKLTELYGIIPKPGKKQLAQGDEYYIKTIDNLLPKN